MCAVEREQCLSEGVREPLVLPRQLGHESSRVVQLRGERVELASPRLRPCRNFARDAHGADSFPRDNLAYHTRPPVFAGELLGRAAQRPGVLSASWGAVAWSPTRPRVVDVAAAGQALRADQPFSRRSISRFLAVAFRHNKTLLRPCTAVVFHQNETCLAADARAGTTT